MQGKVSAAPGIGIDLGTAYSCVAIWMNHRIKIIPNDQGSSIPRSVVAFLEKEQLIRKEAKNQVAMNQVLLIQLFGGFGNAGVV